MGEEDDDIEEAKSLVSAAPSTTNKSDKKKKKGGMFKRKKKKKKGDGDGDNDDSGSVAVAKEIDDANAKLEERAWPFGNRPMSLSEKATLGAGTIGAVVSIGTITLLGMGSLVVPGAAMAATFVAGGAAVVSAPQVIINEPEIAQMDTFRDVINQMREGVNTFGDENKKLGSSVDDLLEHVNALKEVENGLREVAEKQGMQLDELNELIAENKRINKELKKVLKASALQRIFALLIECDIDGDYKLSKQEITRFAMGLTQIEDLPMDTAELVAKLKEFESFDLSYFLQLIQDLILPEEDEEEEEEEEKDNDGDDEKGGDDDNKTSVSNDDSSVSSNDS